MHGGSVILQRDVLWIVRHLHFIKDWVEEPTYQRVPIFPCCFSEVRRYLSRQRNNASIVLGK